MTPTKVITSHMRGGPATAAVLVTPPSGHCRILGFTRDLGADVFVESSMSEPDMSGTRFQRVPLVGGGKPVDVYVDQHRQEPAVAAD